VAGDPAMAGGRAGDWQGQEAGKAAFLSVIAGLDPSAPDEAFGEDGWMPGLGPGIGNIPRTNLRRRIYGDEFTAPC
jgi:hypothetical protein